MAEEDVAPGGAFDGLDLFSAFLGDYLPGANHSEGLDALHRVFGQGLTRAGALAYCEQLLFNANRAASNAYFRQLTVSHYWQVMATVAHATGEVTTRASIVALPSRRAEAVRANQVRGCAGRQYDADRGLEEQLVEEPVDSRDSACPGCSYLACLTRRARCARRLGREYLRSSQPRAW